jgi:hypothetical protein
MHEKSSRNAGDRFDDLRPGDDLGELRVTVSEAANRRYHEAAGVSHPALSAGALYPPIAANLTILLFQQVCADAVLQTRERLRCHRRAQAGTPLVVTGRITQRFVKRGREYADVEVDVADEAGALIWTSVATFTPAAAR